MFPRVLVLALTLSFSLPLAFAQESPSHEEMLNSLSTEARAARRVLDRDVRQQVTLLTGIRASMTERDRDFVRLALEEGSENLRGAIGERIRAAEASFTVMRCPEGTRAFVSDRDEDACEFSDGSYDYPLLHKWVYREGDLLFARTYRQGHVADEGDYEVLMCSRLNLITEELLGRSAEEAVDSALIGYNVYARTR